MSKLPTLFIVAAALMWSAAPGIAGLGVGSSQQDVIDTLGNPEFQYSRSGKDYYTYYGLEIELEDGKVTNVPFGLSHEIAKREGERKDDQERQAASAKRGRGKPKVVKQPTRKSDGSHGAGVQVISNGGNQVDVNRYVGKGKVTIVDFYADWCGPCRQVAPHLEKLAGSDPHVNLVKIDIVKWGTPVAEQHQVKSVPNMRVYDRSGKMVGKPTSDFRQVTEYVKKAK